MDDDSMVPHSAVGMVVSPLLALLGDSPIRPTLQKFHQ